MRRSLWRAALVAALCTLSATALAQQAKEPFRLDDVPSLAGVPLAGLKARTVVFADQRKDKLADQATGLIAFEDWAREKPLQQRFLSPYPGFAEPALKGGAKRKLSIYVAEARFVLAKPMTASDLARYVDIAFLERIDPAIKHTPVAADEVAKREGEGLIRPPDRNWCSAGAVCVQSRYKFEGKIPAGIRLANKLRDESKKPIPDFIAFQSEIRLLPPEAPELADVARLTGLDAPVAGVLEQTVFWVNQIMEFGKLLAVLQQHPGDARATIATIYLVVAVRNDIIARQRDYAKTPVLRNLVPAQLLMGHSSFNTGSSISAGLPEYARSRVKAIANLIVQE